MEFPLSVSSVIRGCIENVTIALSSLCERVYRRDAKTLRNQVLSLCLGVSAVKNDAYI